MKTLSFDSAASIAHAYILSSPSRHDALSAAKTIASAAVCLEKTNVPCGVCRNCRKAAAGIHPDIVTVSRQADQKGNLRRELTISQVREIILDAQLRPVEAERKVYIVEEAELMNLNAQNAALKLLEEPPAAVVLILCVPSPELLLETVRSRCALISLSGDEDRTDETSAVLAAGFLDAVADGDRDRLFRWIAKNEIGKINETAAFLDACMERLADMLCGRTDAGRLSPEQAMRLCRLLERCSGYLRVNVGPKHIFSLLTVESIELENQNDPGCQY